jgi:hypothetical protein
MFHNSHQLDTIIAEAFNTGQKIPREFTVAAYTAIVAGNTN